MEVFTYEYFINMILDVFYDMNCDKIINDLWIFKILSITRIPSSTIVCNHQLEKVLWIIIFIS